MNAYQFMLSTASSRRSGNRLRTARSIACWSLPGQLAQTFDEPEEYRPAGLRNAAKENTTTPTITTTITTTVAIIRGRTVAREGDGDQRMTQTGHHCQCHAIALAADADKQRQHINLDVPLHPKQALPDR